MATKKKKQKDKSFLRVLVIIIKIEPLTTHLTQSPTYYTTSVAMSSENDDNLPCGVQPHAQASWRAKYEYMDRLWIKQGKEIAELKAQLAKKDAELQGALAKKDAELANKYAELDKRTAEKATVQAATLWAELAKNSAELAKKDAELAKKDAELAKKDAELAKKDGELASLLTPIVQPVITEDPSPSK